MPTTPETSARDIRIDVAGQRLWIDGREIALRPKTWLVLRALSERPGVLVSKEDLLEAVWPGTAVADGTLNKSIGELRAALGDDKDAPTWIETAPRRGFRWVAGKVAAQQDPAAAISGKAAVPPGTSAGGQAIAHFVGCEKQLEKLSRHLDLAATGARQLVFLTGEAGAGKSTLVDAFVAASSARHPAALVARGHCIEAFGQHEPYRPLLEAIDDVIDRSGVGPALVESLRKLAPSLARQLPSIGQGAMPADAQSASPRLLRDVTVAIEELSRGRPFVVVIEDVHWADLATLDALNLLARRRDKARLLVLATLRSADAMATAHPVLATKTDLTSRSLAVEVATAPMGEEGIRTYVEARCEGFDLARGHASWIVHQTNGNPLFVRIVVDDLIARGMLVRDDAGTWRLDESTEALRGFVPDNLRELVERQIDSLSPAERSVVEAASVLSGDFDASWLASPAGLAIEEAEDACAQLARREQVLRASSRARSERFTFVHSLVQRILCNRIPASRLRSLHLAAAQRLQATSSAKSDTYAIELALHLAMSGDNDGAIRELRRAAAAIQFIPAPSEVIPIRRRILELIEANPSMPGFRRERVVAIMELSSALQLAFGGVDAEVTSLCERVLELGVEDEDAGERFTARIGIMYGRYYAARYGEALAIAAELLELAKAMEVEPFVQTIEFSMATFTYRRGEIDAARRHFEACLEWNADPHLTFGWNFHCMSLSHLALIAVHDGNPGRARELIARAYARLRPDGVPRDASVIPMLAWSFAVLGDDASARRLVDRALLLSDRLDSVAWFERARFLDGLLLSRQGLEEEGLRRMRASLDRQDRHGLLLDRSAYYGLLGGELLRCGRDGCEEVLNRGIAHVESTGEGHFEAELFRLRGLFRASLGHAEADADLERSIDAAKRRGDRWTVLRSSLALVARPANGGDPEARRRLLEDACSPFTGEDEPREVAEARRVLGIRAGS